MKECVDDTRNEKERGRDVEEIFFKPCVDSKGRCVEVGLEGVVEEGATYAGISTSGTLIWEKLRIRSEHQWFAY
jgi:hypothetical protein